jgi:predicted metal-dependent phosphoesterase TrpH
MEKIEFRADLHCHTSCSDGSNSPEEILHLAKEIGLSGLSITDHDTIEAYGAAIPIAKELEIPLVSGIEFSAEHKGSSVHILGYSFSLNDPGLLAFCQKHAARRDARNRKILEKLKEQRIEVSEEEIKIDNHQTIGRPHIALVMMKKGYVESVQEAFDKYLGDGKLCFAPGESYSIEETLAIIHNAKGLAVLAHPHLLHNPTLLSELLEMNFDGLEGYYGRFPRDRQDKWLQLAKKKGWIVTGGSDFHGSVKPHSALGSSWVCEETFNILLNHFINLEDT